MPLPQQVVEQLRRDPVESQGWAWGILFFSIGIFALTVILYAGLKFGYEPYLTSQISKVSDQVSKASQSVSASDESQLVDFYSQVANLNSSLADHVAVSQLFTWLEKNTEGNVYYSSFTLASGGRISLKGVAKTEADVNQQIAIFESAPEVQSVTVSDVSAVTSGSGYTFDASLAMNPSVFAVNNP